MDIDVVDWIGLLAALIASLILAPISLYTLTRFVQLRMANMIKNRQQKLVYYMNILSISGLLFQWAELNRNVWEIHMNPILTQVIYTVDCIFIWSVFALFCIKTWLLFYDKQYHEANADQIWKTQINQQYTSWYISNKHRWGNFDYIVKIIIIPLICCVCLESILEVMFLLRFNIHSMIILSIIWLPPSCILLVYLKGFDDSFGIKQEIFYQIIIMITILCIHIVQFLFQIRNILNSVNNTLVHRIDWLLAIIVNSITLFSMSFISTAYPIYLHKNKRKLKLNILQQHSNSIRMSQISKDGDMLSVIRHKKGFQAFMSHLVHEFATENLLFVLELIQIKYDFFDNNAYIKDMFEVPFNPTVSAKKRRNSFLPMSISLTDKKDKDIQIESYLFSASGLDTKVKPWGKIKFPFSLPQTELLTIHKNLRDQLHALYDKYVGSHSLYTINISYTERNKLHLFFNPPEPAGMTESKKQMILAQIKHLKLFNIQSSSIYQQEHDHDIEADRKVIKHVNTPRTSHRPTPVRTSKDTDDNPNDWSPVKTATKSKFKPNSLKSISIALPKIQKRAYPHTPSNKLSQDLTTPIIENDNFPDVELTLRSGESEVNHELSTSQYLNRDDIPEDFMVILDYNMDEGEKEEEDVDGVEHEIKQNKESEKITVNGKFNVLSLQQFEDMEEKEESDENVDEIEKEKMFDLLNIMDNACIEIIALMFGSYSRFVQTSNGKQLIKSLCKESGQ